MATYIQIGSNRGKDWFQNLITNLPTSNNYIHLIEPNSQLLQELKANYSSVQNQNIKIHNIAITPHKQRSASLYTHGNPDHASLIQRKSHNVGGDIIECKCLTLNQFFKKNKIVEVDLLLLDCEGLDVEILKNTNLSLANIKSIVYEHWPYENDDANNRYQTGPTLSNNLIQDMLSQGYTCESVLIDGQPNIKLTKLINL